MDPEWFFPERNELHTAGAKAQIICMGCRVRPECKQYRDDTQSKYGIWAAEYTKRD